MLSAKSILTNHNFLESAKLDRKKHPKNEFQAYAYRLAHDLNDLEHLQIYMKLAKNVERSLMERAYSFVIDSRSKEKSRLFLWKLKKIRREIQKKKDFENFDYDFVMKIMCKFRNRIAKLLIEKSDLEFTSKVEMIFKDNIKVESPKQKVLVIGNSSIKLAKFLQTTKLATTVLDISKEVNNLVKAKVKATKIKFILKDFLKKDFKEGYFDYVIIHNFWHVIPMNDEIKFMKKITNILKPNGVVILNTKHVARVAEAWKEYMFEGEELCYFTKSSTKTSIRELFEKFEFRELCNENIDGCEYFVFNIPL